MRVVFLAAVLTVATTFAGEAADDRSRLPLPVRPCAVCHGNGGISELPGIPNLAGQKVEYLVKQITHLHLSANTLLGRGSARGEGPPTLHQKLWSEHRENRMMMRQTADIGESDVQAIAEYYAAKPRACPPPGTARETRPTIITRCAVCHGENGDGVTQHVPNLAGQHRLYLSDQVKKMRSAEKGEVFIDADIARLAGVMGPQSVLVPEDLISPIAAWFANAPCAENK